MKLDLIRNWYTDLISNVINKSPMHAVWFSHLFPISKEELIMSLVHWRWCHWVSNWDNIGRVWMVSRRKHHRSPDRWHHVPRRRSSNWMPNRRSVHAYAGYVRRLWPVLHRWSYSGCGWHVHGGLLAGNWRERVVLMMMMMRRSSDISIVDACNVMDAGSPPISIHWVEANEVLLGMASHLRGSPGNYKVPWNASPISLPKLVKTKQKQPIKEKPT